ncbi:MAG TPA: tRNA lysidine(34) synthetase TilS, partial [Terriglobales bacterium]|nr:tRNA lysidine(34) synthetase TilS [Terriglobales bacterium]
QLLNPQCLGGGLIVRNWRHGDRYWPAHTKSPKKVKELLQKKTEAERKVWPVITSGGEIIWMRGFPAPARVSLPADAPASASGLLIEELEAENLRMITRPGR